MDESVRENKKFFEFQKNDRESKFGKTQVWDMAETFSDEDDEQRELYDYIIFGPNDSEDQLFYIFDEF